MSVHWKGCESGSGGTGGGATGTSGALMLSPSKKTDSLLDTLRELESWTTTTSSSSPVPLRSPLRPRGNNAATTTTTTTTFSPHRFAPRGLFAANRSPACSARAPTTRTTPQSSKLATTVAEAATAPPASPPPPATARAFNTHLRRAKELEANHQWWLAAQTYARAERILPPTDERVPKLRAKILLLRCREVPRRAASTSSPSSTAATTTTCNPYSPHPTAAQTGTSGQHVQPSTHALFHRHDRTGDVIVRPVRSLAHHGIQSPLLSDVVDPGAPRSRRNAENTCVGMNMDDEVIDGTAHDNLDDASDADADTAVDDEGGGVYRVPSSTFDRLYDYQRQCVHWLCMLHAAGSGGLLGDDMGLGKTVQLCAFLSTLHRSRLCRSVLIVVPVSLVTQWESELHKWVPDVRVLTLEGTDAEREKRHRAVLNRGGVLLCTYGLVGVLASANAPADAAADASADATTTAAAPIWDYIVLDEGHRIKNHRTQTYQHLKSIRSRRRIVITGTAIHNRLDELWSLFDFITDGTLFGSLAEFCATFSTVIERGNERDADDATKARALRTSVALQQRIQPYYLRREKRDFPELFGGGRGGGGAAAATAATVTSENDSIVVSDAGVATASVAASVADSHTSHTSHTSSNTGIHKNDLVVWVYLSASQRALYRSFVTSPQAKSILFGEGRAALAALTYLKRLCSHPRLLKQFATLQRAMRGRQEQHGNDDSDDNDDEDADDAVEVDWSAVDQLASTRRVKATSDDLPTAIDNRSNDENDDDDDDAAIAVPAQTPPSPSPSTSSKTTPSKTTSRRSILDELRTVSDDQLISECAKLNVLVRLLESHRAAGHRTLVFSQSTQMLDVIGRLLHHRRLTYVRIDGSITKARDRQQRIQQFVNDPSILCFLLTTQVGGVGLNLVAANRVIIYDPAWSPAVDEQAVDRAFRLGQTRHVIVYRLVTCGTIEECMYRRQVFKSSLVKSLHARAAVAAPASDARTGVEGEEGSNVDVDNDDDGADSTMRQRITSYFTKAELCEVFAFDHPRKSVTCELLRSLHPPELQRRSYNALDEHIREIEEMRDCVFGISDHDLLFSKSDVVSVAMEDEDDRAGASSSLATPQRNGSSSACSTVSGGSTTGRKRPRPRPQQSPEREPTRSARSIETSREVDGRVADHVVSANQTSLCDLDVGVETLPTRSPTSKRVRTLTFDDEVVCVERSAVPSSPSPSPPSPKKSVADLVEEVDVPMQVDVTDRVEHVDREELSGSVRSASVDLCSDAASPQPSSQPPQPSSPPLKPLSPPPVQPLSPPPQPSFPQPQPSSPPQQPLSPQPQPSSPQPETSSTTPSPSSGVLDLLHHAWTGAFSAGSAFVRRMTRPG